MNHLPNNIGQRVCTSCKTLKPFAEFHRMSRTKDGVRPSCKICILDTARRLYKENPSVRQRCKRNSAKYHRCLVADKVRYRKRLDWFLRRYHGSEDVRRRQIENQRLRYQRVSKTPFFKLRICVGAGIRSAIRGQKNSIRSFELVGYSLTELKRHIELQFLPGMNWENFGEWHIDHIVPISAFDFSENALGAVKDAWSLTNLRPLWKKDNLSKHAKRQFLI